MQSTQHIVIKNKILASLINTSIQYERIRHQIEHTIFLTVQARDHMYSQYHILHGKQLYLDMELMKLL